MQFFVRSFFRLAVLLSAISGGKALASIYTFTTHQEYVRMPDGVWIATTVLKPKARFKGERFPVILELQPQRKDDLSLRRDYSLHSYFASYGFVMVKADLRGTGSSSGPTPLEEFSDLEINDAVELIRYYARQNYSNGNAGMWGTGWGGINSLVTATKQPPELKAIIAAHPTEDQYDVSMDNDLSVPRAPHYKMDGEYFRDRFNQEPWFLRYKRDEQNESQQKILRDRYHHLRIPTLLISGLFDNSGNMVPNVLESALGPVRALVGPWKDSWPDSGETSLNWRDEALKWWQRWLIHDGEDNNSEWSNKLVVFQRPGHWRMMDWPVTQSTRIVLLEKVDGQTFESETFEEPLEILGVPEIHGVKSAARLEDVHPSGQSQVIAESLRFTTWTFQKGRRVRIVLPEAQANLTQVILELPVSPPTYQPAPPFTHVKIKKPDRPHPSSRLLSANWPEIQRNFVDSEGRRHVVWEGNREFEVNDRRHQIKQATYTTTSAREPSKNEFVAIASHEIQWSHRSIKTQIEIRMQSTLESVEIQFTRYAFENNRLLRSKTWTESIPRH